MIENTVETREINVGGKKRAIALTAHYKTFSKVHTVREVDRISNDLLLVHPHKDVLKAKGFNYLEYEQYVAKDPKQAEKILIELQKPANQRKNLSVHRIHAVIAVPKEFPFTRIPKYFAPDVSATTSLTVHVFPVLRSILGRSHVLYLGVGAHEKTSQKIPRALELGDFKYSVAGVGVVTNKQLGYPHILIDGKLNLALMILALSSDRGVKKDIRSNLRVLKNAMNTLQRVGIKKPLDYVDRLIVGVEAERLHNPVLPRDTRNARHLAEELYGSRLSRGVNASYETAAGKFIDEKLKELDEYSDPPHSAYIATKIGWTVDRVYSVEAAVQELVEILQRKNKQVPQNIQSAARVIGYFMAGMPLSEIGSLGSTIGSPKEEQFRDILETLFREDIPFADPVLRKNNAHEDDYSLIGNNHRSDIRSFEDLEYTIHPHLKIKEIPVTDEDVKEIAKYVRVDQKGRLYITSIKGFPVVSLGHLLGKKIAVDSIREVYNVPLADDTVKNIRNYLKHQSEVHGIEPPPADASMNVRIRDVLQDIAYIREIHLAKKKEQDGVEPSIAQIVGKEYARWLTKSVQQVGEKGEELSIDELLQEVYLRMNNKKIKKLSKDVLNKVPPGERKGLKKKVRQTVVDMHNIYFAAIAQHHVEMPEIREFLERQLRRNKAPRVEVTVAGVPEFVKKHNRLAEIYRNLQNRRIAVDPAILDVAPLPQVAVRLVGNATAKYLTEMLALKNRLRTAKIATTLYLAARRKDILQTST